MASEEAKRLLGELWSPLQWRLVPEAHRDSVLTCIQAALDAAFDRGKLVATGTTLHDHSLCPICEELKQTAEQRGREQHHLRFGPCPMCIELRNKPFCEACQSTTFGPCPDCAALVEKGRHDADCAFDMERLRIMDAAKAEGREEVRVEAQAEIAIRLARQQGHPAEAIWRSASELPCLQPPKPAVLPTPEWLEKMFKPGELDHPLGRLDMMTPREWIAKHAPQEGSCDRPHQTERR